MFSNFDNAIVVTKSSTTEIKHQLKIFAYICFNELCKSQRTDRIQSVIIRIVLHETPIYQNCTQFRERKQRNKENGHLPNTYVGICAKKA